MSACISVLANTEHLITIILHIIGLHSIFPQMLRVCFPNCTTFLSMFFQNVGDSMPNEYHTVAVLHCTHQCGHDTVSLNDVNIQK